MNDLLVILYPWIKSLHLIAVISWMAGLLYLPRLFVYHVETDKVFLNTAETIEKWEVLLLKRILNPAMISTWVFGIILALTPGIIDFSAVWVYVKLTMVIFMTGFHGFLSKERRLLLTGKQRFNGRQYRFINEIPTILMIIIIIAVIVRPI